MQDIEYHITSAIRGDRSSQKALYDEYKISFYKLCLLYVKDRQISEDLLQKGFLKIFKSLDTYEKNKAKFSTWGRRIMVNTCLDYLKKRKKLVPVEDIGSVIDKVEKNYSVLPLENLELKDIYQILDSLPEGYKIVFNLYVIEGYNHREIGELLDISENTSKSQLSKAKKKLRKIINNYFPEYSTRNGQTAKI